MIRSRIALLGTLRELHTELPGYNLQRLEELVAAKNPDLLCVEIDRQDWESNDLEQSPMETREVLARLSLSSEITVIPIGADGRSWAESGIPSPTHGILASFRRRLSRMLNAMTIGLMKLAGGPRAINSPVIEHFCGAMCDLQLLLADPEARSNWIAKNQELLNGIRWILERDPGRRVLVTLDCRRKHWLRHRLRLVPEVTVVDLWKF